MVVYFNVGAWRLSWELDILGIHLPGLVNNFSSIVKGIPVQVAVSNVTLKNIKG